MRADFVAAVDDVLAADARVAFVTGDLGFNAFEGLAARHGRRFINAGVAEQSMMGIAAGLALTGLLPWVYSIVPFITYRCLEQIRNDVCLHELPVRIVGNGGGYTYGVMGSTHHGLEDLAVLKVMPNMQLFFPCAGDQVAAAVRAMGALAGPSYLRLAVSGFAVDRAPLAENAVTLTRRYAARAQRRQPGVTVIAAGHAAHIAAHALDKLGLDRDNVDVFGVARFPFDLDADADLVTSARETRHVIFIEEHYAAGGLGESMKMALPPLEAFHLMSARYRPDQRYGSPAFHLRQSQLTPEALVAAVRTRLGAKGTG